MSFPHSHGAPKLFKTILVLSLCLTGLSAFAQSAPKHLVFAEYEKRKMVLSQVNLKTGAKVVLNHGVECEAFIPSSISADRSKFLACAYTEGGAGLFEFDLKTQKSKELRAPQENIRWVTGFYSGESIITLSLIKKKEQTTVVGRIAKDRSQYKVIATLPTTWEYAKAPTTLFDHFLVFESKSYKDNQSHRSAQIFDLKQEKLISLDRSQRMPTLGLDKKTWSWWKNNTQNQIGVLKEGKLLAKNDLAENGWIHHWLTKKIGIKLVLQSFKVSAKIIDIQSKKTVKLADSVISNDFNTHFFDYDAKSCTLVWQEYGRDKDGRFRKYCAATLEIGKTDIKLKDKKELCKTTRLAFQPFLTR